ncbi:MAG: Zn-ribbon domain-containing OB-fold protein [Candidatus Binatia bacterium]
MPGQIDYSKIVIVPDFDTSEWWQGTKQHKYLVRQCKTCGHKWFPPFPACSKCTSMELTWFETAGKGIIHSYIVVTQPILSAFVDAVPYVVGLIELDDCHETDGSLVRVAGTMMDNEAAVAIGLPVEVVFQETKDPNIVIPRWKISGPAENTWKFSE